MANSEVYELALSWMSKCKCVKHMTNKRPTPQDYPTRLIDLSRLKLLGYIDPDKWWYHGVDKLKNERVRLVETDKVDWSIIRNCLYVTLSHKWGGNIKQAKLTSETRTAFQRGLLIKNLPRTFRDAIIFATRLHNVGYIWIDSLCIVQDDREDWLRESALMQKVYRNSFLNISATAGQNSDDGLYSQREPQQLWEDIVSLNIDGLARNGTSQADVAQSGAERQQAVRIDNGAESPLHYKLTNSFTTIRSCLLLDVSIWDAMVNQAPVNRRGWVVQERLIAPRVLHFCRGRIAWECREFDEIEGRGPGIPSFQLIGDKLYERVPMKGLDPAFHGQRLRQNRLRGNELPQELNSDFEKAGRAQEIWARIVEMYSKTNLTKAEDKLVALSGIAHQMATVIGSEAEPAEYVAGLWKPFLVSQLLWKVEPAFSGSRYGTGVFEYPSTRPKTYRAPSFSWASVDVKHERHGSSLTYGEPLGPQDLVFIEIEQKADKDVLARDVDKGVWVETSTKNKYGLVNGGHLLLWGWVRRVKMQRDGAFFSWYLRGRNRRSKDDASNKDLTIRVDAEQHLNVFMDCPGGDNENDRLIHSESVYCLPVALGLPTAVPESKDLTCLLLEQVPQHDQMKHRGWDSDYRGAFRRIGLTKLTPSFDSLAMTHILERLDGDQDIIPETHLEGYDERTGRHLIRLI